MTLLFHALAALLLLYAIVLHEVGHAWMARRCGDDTAERLGRITLNPVAHIDPVGTVLVPLLLFVSTGTVFGWAKPVPVNPLRYRRMRRDDILVSLAGIVVNLGLAVVCALFLAFPLLVPDVGPAPDARVFVRLPFSGHPFFTPDNLAARLFFFGVLVNVGLAVFNLLPIPPLDGSHLLKQLLPDRLSAEYERMGFFGVLAILLIFHLVPEANLVIWVPLNWFAGGLIELALLVRSCFGG